MKTIAPRRIQQTVLVIGDEASDKNEFIQKCTRNPDSVSSSTIEYTRIIPFGNDTVELTFSACDTSIDETQASSADVLIFCFNINRASSYKAMKEALERLHPIFTGIIAMVACVSQGEKVSNASPLLADCRQLNIRLNDVHPDTWLEFFISRNHDETCGVTTLLLNLLADKQLKLLPVKASETLTGHRPLKHPKPILVLNGLVLGADGVGKSSIICQAVGYQNGQEYPRRLMPARDLLEFAEHDVALTLTDTLSTDPIPPHKNHFAILCFDLSNLNTLTMLYDKIKMLIHQDNKILFALLGNKRDLVMNDESKMGVADEVSVITKTLGELYPYHFMGVYLNSTLDKRFNQIPPLVNILCENYREKFAEEAALVSRFKQAHQSMPTHFFSRSNVPDNTDLDFLIHNASREDIETRSNIVFKTLGWFDNHGRLSANAPELIKQRRRSLDLSGIGYAKKINPSL